MDVSAEVWNSQHLYCRMCRYSISVILYCTTCLLVTRHLLYLSSVFRSSSSICANMFFSHQYTYLLVTRHVLYLWSGYIQLCCTGTYCRSKLFWICFWSRIFLMDQCFGAASWAATDKILMRLREPVQDTYCKPTVLKQAYKGWINVYTVHSKWFKRLKMRKVKPVSTVLVKAVTSSRYGVASDKIIRLQLYNTRVTIGIL
jgi:hypothetical protein